MLNLEQSLNFQFSIELIQHSTFKIPLTINHLQFTINLNALIK